MTKFTTEAFDAIRDGTRRSADAVVPLLLSLDSSRDALRVLDVGCGEGWWSRALLDRGHDVESIDNAKPEAPAPGVDVMSVELEDRWHMLRAPYDLVLCLEVAEHLSEIGGARLVASLTAATSRDGMIAFSAAIPGQRGLGHINEQWPAYWDRLFRRHDWMLCDPLRERLWDDERVEPWYRQNLLVARAPSANGTRWALGSSPRRLVHPSIWEWRLRDVDYWRGVATSSVARGDSATRRAP